MTRVTVRLTPRAARDRIAGFDERGRLLLRVTAAPVDGAANAACLRLVAKALGIAPSRVALVAGRRSRDKVLEVVRGGQRELSRESPWAAHRRPVELPREAIAAAGTPPPRPHAADPDRPASGLLPSRA